MRAVWAQAIISSFLPVLFAALATGCADSSAPSLHLNNGALDAAIIGGIDVNKVDFVAAMTVGVYNVETGGRCTGALISKNFVLTAAHCISAPPQDLVILFGLDFTSDTLIDRPVVDYEISPLRAKRHNESVDSGDIALVKFSGGIPRGYRPARLLERTDVIANGDLLTLAGYGLADGRRRVGDGRLRKTDARVKEARFGKSEILIDQTNGRGACDGDSGGPAFLVNGETIFVVGVTSRTASDPRNTCSRYTVYSSVPAYINWLRAAARQLNSRKSTAPAHLADGAINRSIREDKSEAQQARHSSSRELNIEDVQIF